ncbi:hypothetical protein [Paenibacillus yonginensis]|nr:hypothetical protein [Paenibacillus yonginensis]
MHGTVKPAVADNPPQTKQNLQQALLLIIEPLKPYYSEERDWRNKRHRAN